MNKEILMNLVGIVVTILTRIQELLGSNFSQNTEYPDWGSFVDFLSSSGQLVG
jgi:hypothetical protein